MDLDLKTAIVADDVLKLRQTTATAAFLRWLTRTLFTYLYPGAPVAKVAIPLELLLLIFAKWPLLEQAAAPHAAAAAAPVTDAYLPYMDLQTELPAGTTLHSFDDVLASPLASVVDAAATMSLINMLINTWDRSREPSLQLLRMFPSPLPGIASPQSLCDLFMWTVHLCRSPRLRECDAGALILRAVFSRCVPALRFP